MFFIPFFILKITMQNVLIVEDNAFIAKSIANASKKIRSIGNLHLTTSLQKAITLISNTDINLIILDLNLQDGNGLDLLKILKEKKIEKKVLVFSSDIHLKTMCLKYGAFAFFDKANDFDELIETIKNNHLENVFSLN